MKLYIMRHGETPWNVEHRLQGTTDIELNENGISLAKATGKALKNIPFDLCFSSPLKRARKTADCVLGNRKIPVFTDQRLQEISFGDMEGIPSDQLPEHMLDNFFHHTEQYIAPVGGESISQVCQRAGAFFDELLHKQELQDKTILIASHGCTVRALLQKVYHNTDRSAFWHGCVPPNCSINIVEVTNGIPKLIEEDRVFG